MSDAEWFGPAHGRQINADWPDDQLAVLDCEHTATPWVVENARRHFKEASLSDFQALGTLGRRWLHRESGIEYILDESQVLMAPVPTDTGVEYFVVHGYKIMFLRPRDFDPVTRKVLVHEVVAREVPNDFQPPPRNLRKVIALRLHGESGREARDRERARVVDQKLASVLGERWEFYRLHGVFPPPRR